MIFAGLGGACLKREGLAASMLSSSLLLWNDGGPVFDVIDGGVDLIWLGLVLFSPLFATVYDTESANGSV